MADHLKIQFNRIEIGLRLFQSYVKCFHEISRGSSFFLSVSGIIEVASITASCHELIILERASSIQYGYRKSGTRSSQPRCIH